MRVRASAGPHTRRPANATAALPPPPSDGATARWSTRRRGLPGSAPHPPVSCATDGCGVLVRKPAQACKATDGRQPTVSPGQHKRQRRFSGQALQRRPIGRQHHLYNIRIGRGAVTPTHAESSCGLIVTGHNAIIFPRAERAQGRIQLCLGLTSHRTAAARRAQPTAAQSAPSLHRRPAGCSRSVARAVLLQHAGVQLVGTATRSDSGAVRRGREPTAHMEFTCGAENSERYALVTTKH